MCESPSEAFKKQDCLRVNHLNTKKSEPLKVIRQYVTPAIYVESSIYDMAPFKKSFMHLNYVSDDEIYHKPIRVKRCCCLTSPTECPCHPLQNYEQYADLDTPQTIVNSDRDSNVSQVSFKSNETASTIKPAKYSNEFRLSITSLTSPSTGYLSSDLRQKEDVFKKWCEKKAMEKRKKEEMDAKRRLEKEREREQMLEIERENFRKWLINKKKEEEQRKKAQEKKLQEEKLKEEMKEKRMMENELHYKLWLKKKEEQTLVKKLEEQIKMVKDQEQRQKRLQESIAAYNDWLKNSKNKPKPLPLNQGLQSLRSAVSVSYINPTPWIPNVDLSPKPSSQ